METTTEETVAQVIESATCVEIHPTNYLRCFHDNNPNPEPRGKIHWVYASHAKVGDTGGLLYLHSTIRGG
ncbi:MAG: hypothetical protein ACREAU_02960 [Nitrosopumilaceae archaeon]